MKATPLLSIFPLPLRNRLQRLPRSSHCLSLGKKLEIPEAPATAGAWIHTTVSLAFRILVFLALVAAAVVFHRDLGNGLIWLGARLSGTPAMLVNRAQHALHRYSRLFLRRLPYRLLLRKLRIRRRARRKKKNPASSAVETKKPSETAGAVRNSQSPVRNR